MIDIRTLYSVAGLINILLSTGLLLLLWWRSRTPYVLIWGLSNLAVTIGSIGTALDKVLPDWLGFLSGNVLYLVAGYLTLEGFQSLLGVRRFTGLGLLSLTIGIAVIGTLFLADVNLTYRVAAMSICGVPIAMATAALAFTGGNPPLRLPLAVAGTLYTGNVVLSVVRGVATFTGPANADFFQAPPLLVAVIVGYGVLFLALNADYLWLILADEAARHAAEQDRLLAQLEAQADDLRAAIAAKSAFLATMSHEIRTPLSGVIGFSDVLLRTELTPQQRDYVELQRDAGRGLLAVINGILDFSKLEAGEVAMEPADVDVPAAMESCCGLFRLAAQERQLALRLDLDPAVPRWVRLDGHRLRQVIGNLLSNAVKFTRAGEIVLAIRRQEFRLHFEVSDTGIGIPTDKQPALFREFRQIDGSITREFGGTGLGLAISRRLVALMGGTLALSSEAGIGSRFSFDLPLEIGVAAPEQPEPVPSTERKLRILVAEDTDMNQLLIKLLLTQDGHAVTVVDNGASAVDAVSRQVSTDDAYVNADYTTVAPKVSGYINDVLVEDNQRVAAGQVLARIDDRDFRTALDQAKADVEAADAAIRNIDAQSVLQQSIIDHGKADIAATEATLKFAQQDSARYSELVKTGAGTVQHAQQADALAREKQAQLQGDRAGLIAAQKKIDVLASERVSAEAQRAHSQAVERQAELNLSYTVLTAPVDGTVGARTLRIGQYVQAGTQLMAVVPLQAVYVVANFKETQLTHIRDGQPVAIEVDSFPGVRLSGHVDSLSPASGLEFALLPPDNATGNFTKIVQRIPVKIVVEGGALAGLLRPGMSVEPTIDTKVATKAG